MMFFALYSCSPRSRGQQALLNLQQQMMGKGPVARRKMRLRKKMLLLLAGDPEGKHEMGWEYLPSWKFLSWELDSCSWFLSYRIVRCVFLSVNDILTLANSVPISDKSWQRPPRGRSCTACSSILLLNFFLFPLCHEPIKQTHQRRKVQDKPAGLSLDYSVPPEQC